MEDLLSFTFLCWVRLALLGREPIAWRFLSPDAYTPAAAGVAGAAGAPTVTSGGTVTAANWRKMQMQGCVFLPCAGYKQNSSAREVGSSGYYWLIADAGGAFYFTYKFGGAFSNQSSITPNNGQSVRLVHNL